LMNNIQAGRIPSIDTHLRRIPPHGSVAYRAPCPSRTPVPHDRIALQKSLPRPTIYYLPAKFVLSGGRPNGTDGETLHMGPVIF